MGSNVTIDEETNKNSPMPYVGSFCCRLSKLFGFWVKYITKQCAYNVENLLNGEHIHSTVLLENYRNSGWFYNINISKIKIIK